MLSATLRNTWLNRTSIAIGIVNENISSCGTRAVVNKLRRTSAARASRAPVAFIWLAVELVADTVVIVGAVMIGLQSA